MERGEFLPVAGLVLCAFIFNTSEFMPIGLLTDIASSFSLTEAEAGVMITVYAWAVTLLSLPLMVLASRFEMKRLLLATVALFGAGQFLSASAGNFWMLIGARLLVACAHSVFWSIASPLAVRVVSPRHTSAALGMIVTGTSLAIVCGLPLGRVVGLSVGWRMTFAAIGILSLLAFAYVVKIFPRVPSVEKFSFSEVPSLFRNPALSGLYLLTFLHVTGYYTGYSYIEPFLLKAVGLSEAWVTAILILLGASGLLGSLLFSRMFDTHPLGFLKISVLSAACALLLLFPASVSLVAILAVCVLWGMAVTAYGVASQAEILRVVSVRASAVATSMYSGIFNLGIGFGTYVGGLTCTYLSVADIGLIGGAWGLTAAAYCAFILAGRLARETR